MKTPFLAKKKKKKKFEKWNLTSVNSDIDPVNVSPRFLWAFRRHSGT